MKILVINAGSSSLKYQLMDPQSGDVFAKGLCERIGIDGRLNHKAPAKDVKVVREIPMPTHAEAISAVLDILMDPVNGVLSSVDEIDAVGHRVVHGGMKFAESCLIDEACLEAVRACIPLGPLHNPANLLGIEACQKIMPKTPQVAVFDTAYHMTMPPKAYRYAIPDEYYEKDSLRRYGFHGTSHRYIAKRVEALMGKGLKVVNCHLGNGSSLAAILDGKVVVPLGLEEDLGLVHQAAEAPAVQDAIRVPLVAATVLPLRLRSPPPPALAGQGGPGGKGLALPVLYGFAYRHVFSPTILFAKKRKNPLLGCKYLHRKLGFV